MTIKTLRQRARYRAFRLAHHNARPHSKDRLRSCPACWEAYQTELTRLCSTPMSDLLAQEDELRRQETARRSASQRIAMGRHIANQARLNERMPWPAKYFKVDPPRLRCPLGDL